MPGALLSACSEQVGGEIVPKYLTHRDYAWLGRVLEEHEAHVGQRKVELDRRLSELLLPSSVKPKLRLALRVLDRLSKTKPEAALPPKEARAATFRAASTSAVAPPEARARVLERVAASLGVSTGALEASLFADLPSERRVCSLGTPVAAAVADEINAALVGAWVARALSVRVRIGGDARPLVRHARRAGLICVAIRGKDDTVVLEISGPAVLFRRTGIYGRALSSIVARLRLCEQFELRAVCSIPKSDDTATLRLTHESFAAPGREIGMPDDRALRQFARAFTRCAPEWQLTPDPPAIEAGGVLVFPDFELHPPEPAEPWLLEVVGFWTPEYLRAKLERLSSLGGRFILCVDASRACGESDIPDDPRVIPFRRQIDPVELLAKMKSEP